MPAKPDALSLAEALDIRLPPRQETIDLMLVDHLDVQNTLNSGLGGRGSGNWGFQMPATFTRPHIRLDWLLHQLRCDGPEYVVASDAKAETTRKLYWWPAEFYLRARRVQRVKRREESRRGVKRKTDVLLDGKPQHEIVVLRDAHFDFAKVRAALEWLDNAWLTSFSEQPHHLTGKDWERLLNPARCQLCGAKEKSGHEPSCKLALVA